eukprot:TRINITY_DN2142_c0_g2_i12.p1 TRINITY_DN2142_c0_g2~~TRINITY_DN2142_c0_g2_i12.p1  ORF type:complete len:288 (+),score=56.35 TRINITY_DN2142_c0_g2_i12:392-1255(+)
MFRTLDDLKKGGNQPIFGIQAHSKSRPDPKEDKNKKTTDSYAGGEKSGLAIQNPDLDSIVNKAEKRGPPGAGAGPGDQGDINCRITLYRNGFRINEGEFRDYNAPENKKFMAEINAQRVPSELRDKYPQGLSVGLEDRRQEDYVPPPPPSYVAFSGQGVSLGGAPPIQPAPMAANIDPDSVPKPKVDPREATTNVQIRLSNGKTVRLEVNLKMRVSELHAYVGRCSPMPGGFRLLHGYPPQPVEDLNATMEDANLVECTIVQRQQNRQYFCFHFTFTFSLQYILRKP